MSAAPRARRPLLTLLAAQSHAVVGCFARGRTRARFARSASRCTRCVRSAAASCRPAAQAPELEGGSFEPPWSASGDQAAALAQGVSPSEAVKKHGKAADVHATMRGLIAEATGAEALQAMPPAWQAWL